MAEESFVICGEKSISWYALVSASSDLIEDEDPISLTFFRAILLVSLLRGLLLQNSEPGLVKSTFPTLMEQMREKQATDPRDKIFALHGVFEAVGISFPAPDYTKTIEQVYRDATKASIQLQDSLMILEQVHGQSTLPGLPSWVPDWSSTSPLSAFSRGDNSNKYKATKDSVPIFRFSGDDSKLTLSGVIVSEVKARGELVHIPPEAHASIDRSSPRALIKNKLIPALRTIRVLRQWIEIASGVQRLDEMSPTLLKCFIMTVFADSKDLQAIDPAEHTDFMRRFSKWYHILTRERSYFAPGGDTHPLDEARAAENRGGPRLDAMFDDPEIFALARTLEFDIYVELQRDKDSFQFHKELENRDHDRVFFVTEQNHMGMALTTIRKGDFVALFSGMQVPVLIRPEGSEFRLIGAVYVRGIMGGEAWHDELKLEGFTLV